MSVFAEFSVETIYCPFDRELLSHPSTRLEFERIVPMETDVQYIWIVGEAREGFLSDLQENPAVETVRLVDELPDRTLISARWAMAENPVLQVLADVEATLVGATATADGWHLQLRCPDPDRVSAFYTGCLDRGIRLDLRQASTTTNPGSNPYYGLSRKQAETVIEAFERGYFSVPRDVTNERLAELLGVSPQAVSERMRRGIRTLIATTLSDEADFDEKA